MKINIETIPIEQMRYKSAGDYWWDEDGTLQIRVCKLSDPRYEEAIAIHELFEALLCKNKGVTEESITVFDIEFEKNIENEDKEPGDETNAPYRDEHNFATAVERMFIAAQGIPWNEYDGDQLKEVKKFDII